MLTEKERIQLEEHELYEDISDVEELRKQENLEAGEKTKPSKAVGFTFLLLFLLFAGVVAWMYLHIDQYVGEYYAADSAAAELAGTEPAEGGTAETIIYGLMGVFGILAVICLIAGFAGLGGKGHKTTRVTRDEYAPTYVPEGELTLSSDEPLVGANKAKIKRIKDDMAKRKLTDKRKAQRILDPSITFEGLRKALTVSFARHGLELSDEAAAKLLAALAWTRVLFVRGIPAESRKDAFEAILEAFEMQGHFTPANKSFEDVLGSVSLLPEKKKSFVLGVNGLYARNVENYFDGYMFTLEDASEDHVFPDGTLISMNLIILAFLDEADDGKGIAPSILLHSAFLKLNLLKLDTPYMGDAFSIRATGDEIRYLSGKETSVSYLSDGKLSSYDVLFAASRKYGHPLPNDVENGLERVAATLLHFGFEEDRVSAYILVTGVLPYILSALSEEEHSAEGSVNEACIREFVSDSEQKEIKEFLSTYIVKEVSEKKMEAPIEEEVPAEEVTPEAEETAEEEKPLEEPKEEAPAAGAKKKTDPKKKTKEKAPKEEVEEAPAEEKVEQTEDEVVDVVEDDIKIVEE